MPGSSTDRRKVTARAAALFALSLFCIGIRLPNLRALPIFGDEAIFLHCAQLIREDAARFLWAPLKEVNPPFHSWLLALSLPFSSDPLTSGRLLSVFLGTLTVFAIYALTRRIDALFREPGTKRHFSPEIAGALAAVLLVFSPLASLSQRMARAEALFLLESILAVWLSLRLATLASAEQAGGLALLRETMIFGALMGVTMLTRQNFSYLLWLAPLLGWWWFTSNTSRQPRWRGAGRLLLAMLVACALALLIWAPMLTARDGPDLESRIFHRSEVRQSITATERLGLTGRNLRDAVASIWIYLSPPIAIFAAVSPVGLFLLRRRRLAGFLLSWMALLLLPLSFVATGFFPRYVVPLLAPLLVGAAILLSEITRSRRSLGGLLALLLLWAVHDIHLQLTDWREQRLVPTDRWQFVSGWAAGYATEQALDFLERRGREGPIVVLTSPDSGNPTDTVWLYGPSRGLRLHASSSLDEPLLVPARRPGAFLLGGDLRREDPVREIRLDAERILYVSREQIYTREGLRPAGVVLGRLNPGIHPVARFENPPGARGAAGDAVVIFEVRRPDDPLPHEPKSASRRGSSLQRRT